MQRIRKSCALLLLLVSGYFVVPAELVHELSFHEDTSDAFCESGDDLSIGTEHHHCEVLQLNVPPCLLEHTTVDFATVASVLPRDLHQAPQLDLELPGTFVIRGPPVIR